MAKQPSHRPPTHPGEMLREAFRRPLGLTQVALAQALHVRVTRVRALEHGRQSVSPEMALRLARCLGTSAELWLTLQRAFDCWQVEHGPSAADIRRIRPLGRSKEARPRR